MLASSLTPQSYRELLPVVWSLLTLPYILPPGRNSQGTDVLNMVGDAFVSHLQGMSSSSVNRGLGDQLLMHFIVQHEDPQSSLPPYVSQGDSFRRGIRDWLEKLPKSLWEIGSKNDSATRGILDFLLEIGLRGPQAFQPPHSLVTSEVSPVKIDRHQADR